jgi:MFS family permease
VGLNLLTLLLYGALSGFLLLLPYRLIEGAGYSATAAAASLLPFPVIMSLGAPIMGIVAGKIGSRIPLVAGSVLVAAALALASFMGPAAPYWTGVLPPVAVMAVGMSCAAAPLTSAVLSSVDARHTGSASGLNSAVARAGGLFVTALLGAALAASGQALTDAFRIAALAGAGLSLAAGLAGLLLIGKDKPKA